MTTTYNPMQQGLKPARSKLRKVRVHLSDLDRYTTDPRFKPMEDAVDAMLDVLSDIIDGDGLSDAESEPEADDPEPKPVLTVVPTPEVEPAEPRTETDADREAIHEVPSKDDNERPVEVGDIFHESWGYDQTNANFYQVVRTTRTGVYLREIQFRQAGDGWNVEPVPDAFIEHEPGTDHRIGKVREDGTIFKRVNNGWTGQPYLNMTTYSGASRVKPGEVFHDTIAAGLPGH